MDDIFVIERIVPGRKKGKEMKKKTKIILLAAVIGILIGSIYGSLRMITGEEIGENLLKNFNFEIVDTSGK